MNYNKYCFSKKELIFSLCIGLIITGSIGILFYRNFLAIIFISPLSLVYLKYQEKVFLERRKRQLTVEFRDGIMGLSAALSVGYSIENSFQEAVRDLKIIYGERSDMVREFEVVCYKIKMNQTVEAALKDFAVRSGIEDIENFAEVFSIAKRTGGDLIKIIKNTSKLIGEKIEVTREAQMLLAGKKYEAKVMNIIPFGIILYMWIFCPEFMEPLYQNIIGRLVMTIALIAYGAAFYLSEHIMDIEI